MKLLPEFQNINTWAFVDFIYDHENFEREIIGAISHFSHSPSTVSISQMAAVVYTPESMRSFWWWKVGSHSHPFFSCIFLVTTQYCLWIQHLLVTPSGSKLTFLEQPLGQSFCIWLNRSSEEYDTSRKMRQQDSKDHWLVTIVTLKNTPLLFTLATSYLLFLVTQGVSGKKKRGTPQCQVNIFSTQHSCLSSSHSVLMSPQKINTVNSSTGLSCSGKNISQVTDAAAQRSHRVANLGFELTSWFQNLIFPTYAMLSSTCVWKLT